MKRLADGAGLDVSSYVLARTLPAPSTKVLELLDALAGGEEHRFVLADLNDVLARLAPAAFVDTLAHLNVHRLSPFLQNYVAAMVEHAAHQKSVAPPAWVHDVDPIDAPYFAVLFPRLRPHLLRSSPVAFKRRNLFVDATVGDRV